jgi:hypothetical protein
MKPATVFQLECASATADRRTLIMRLAFPLLLALPFALVRMPAAARAAGLTALIVFVGFFGAAVACVQRRNDGHWERLLVLPIRPARAFLETVLAGALVDALQVLPPVVLVLAVHARGAPVFAWAAAAACLPAGLLALNLAGTLLGAALRSNPEVHLLAGLGTGLLLFLSGATPAPERLAPAVRALSRLNPAGWCHAALSALLTGAETSL